MKCLIKNWITVLKQYYTHRPMKKGLIFIVKMKKKFGNEEVNTPLFSHADE